jgi:GxxExxY protein
MAIQTVDDVAGQIVDAAIAIHKHLGPGLLESAYVAALQIEFNERGLACRQEVAIQACYRDRPLGVVYRADLLVEERVLVEVKAVLGPEPLHVAQLLSYLRLGGWRLGLLLNFNSLLMKQGIRRIVNGY